MSNMPNGSDPLSSTVAETSYSASCPSPAAPPQTQTAFHRGEPDSDLAVHSHDPTTLKRPTRSSASIEFCGRAAALAFAPSEAGPSSSSSPYPPSSEPTFLFLTQNIGGIDAAGATDEGPQASCVVYSASDALSGETSGSSTTAAALPVDLGHAGTATDSFVPEGSDAYMSYCFSADGGSVAEHTKVMVAEFIADLRGWIHRVAVATQRRREHQQQQQAKEGNGSSSSALPTLEKSKVGVATAAAPSLAAYSPADTPPQIDVIVLHLQEVGGKYMNKGFNAYMVEELRKKLLPEAGWTSGLLMDKDGGEGVAPAESPLSPSPVRSPAAVDAAAAAAAAAAAVTNSFTAMASIVFLSPRMAKISSMLSFPHRTYIPIPDDPCSYGGSDRNVFHTAKFSTAGRSRKGYLLTSLRLGTCELNVCNVHLFNDEDNAEALKKSPSKYVSRRTDAALEAVAESLAVVDKEEPFFLFGDTNMRVDGKQLADHLRSTRQMELRPRKKELLCPESFWPIFYASHAEQQQLRQNYDREPRHIMDAIARQTGMEMAELPVTFAPTYSRLPVSLEERIASQKAASASASASASAAAAMARAASGGTNGAREAKWRSSGGVADGGGGKGRVNEEGTEKEEANGAVASEPPTHLSLLSSTEPEEFPSAPVLADRGRSNFTHQRVPAWCDRIFFNPAALELITGGRFDTARGVARGGDGGGAEGVGEGQQRDEQGRGRASPRHYLYDAVSLLHTDHDGVFLSF